MNILSIAVHCGAVPSRSTIQTTMQPRLTFACNEGWDKMTPGDNGKYCSRCSKEVMDLTGRDTIDLIALLRERSTPICGRVRKDQVFRYAQLPEIMIFRPFRAAHRSSPVLPWLAAGGLLLTTCTNSTLPTEPPAISNAPDTSQEPHDFTTGHPVVDPTPIADTITSEQPITPSTLKISEMFLEGEVAVGGITNEPPDTWHAEIPEVPAAFPGGSDGLMAFVRANLRFPEQEAQDEISGTVVVSFKIDEEGRLIEASVIKDVPGSVNFGPEVLRVIGSMPHWSPALRNGKPMVSQLSLPVRFSR